MATWEIWNRSSNPPGGWHYDQRHFDDSLHRISGITYADLKRKVREHRKSNGIDASTLDADLALQLCAKLPDGWCRKQQAHTSTAITMPQAKRGCGCR
jgi:hypothetical protein